MRRARREHFWGLALSRRDITDASAEKESRRETALVVTFSVVLALVLRTWALHRRGVVDFDECYYYLLGRNLMSGHYTLNGLPHTAFPPLYPALVGAASLVTSSIRAATSAVSALAGGLLPLPVYFLARDVFGRRAAAFAAFAAAALPVLFFVAASGVAYSMRMYFGSEPLYITLLACGVTFIWLSWRRGRLSHAALGGSFFGLASLVRSEGPVIFAFLFVWLAAALLVSARFSRWRRLAIALLAAGAMLAVFSPFLIHVRAQSGRWSLGAKLVNNARIRDTLHSWVVENDSGPFMRRHYALNDDADWMADSYWGVSPRHRETADGGMISGGLQLVLTPDWRWAPRFAAAFFTGPVAILPWYGWAVVALGLFFGPWNARRLAWWGLVGAVFAAMFLLAVSLYVLPRHELPLGALLAVSLGKGLEGAGRLSERAVAWLAPGGEAFRRIACAAPAVVVLCFFVEAGVSLNVAGNLYAGGDVSRREQSRDRAAAESLRAMLPGSPTLMVHSPWTAIWAGAEWRVLPNGAGDRLVHYAKARGMDYALLAPWHRALNDNFDALRPYLAEHIDIGGGYYLFDFTQGQPPGDNGAADQPDLRH